MTPENAYEIAVTNGFRGTEAEWIASLRGPVGERGPPGFNGVNGVPGLKGERGDRGEKGDKGDTGLPGKDGINGLDGLNGIDGKDGKDGLPGKNGKDGKNGLNGKVGPKGPPGKDGKDGIDGNHGKSAHDLWLEQGHTGDFDAFTRWLAQKAGVMTGSIFTNTNNNSVKSVNGQIGVVNLDLNDISDVDTSGVSDGDVLIYQSGVWQPGTGGGGGAVSSVNGQTGVVVLDTADISEATNKKYVTDAQLTVIQNTSGVNTGDQTITLTGDVTGSGTGSFATTLSAALQSQITAGLSGSFGLTIDGGGVITTGSKGYVTIPYACTALNWYLAADQSGSIVIDLKRSGSSIVGAGNKPTLSSTQSGDAAISGWTSTAISAGDIIEFNVDSVSTITRVNLVIKVQK